MARLPKPRFYLRLPKAKTETLISLMVSYQGKRLVYSTSCSIHPQDWDFKVQRPIAKSKRNDLFAIKRELDNIATYSLNIFNESESRAISLKEFRDRLDNLRGIKANSEPSESVIALEKNKVSFFEAIDLEVQEMRATNMKMNSVRMFQNHIRVLKEFAHESFPNKGIEYEDVDWNFRLKLIDWLTDGNVQLSYGNKTLKTLRQFMERARRKKFHSNTDYLGTGWTVTPKKAVGTKVILSESELGYLAKMNLKGYLEKVRDICLIGAGTGQRYSDFSRYKPDNFYRTINNIPILSVISIKTDTPAKIPLNIFPWLIPVLEKHDYATPKMSMQKFNEGIKELCKLAGFDQKLLKVIQYMGRKARIEKLYVPKYQEVSSHICRRSFATNLYRMGYSLAQIMPMTGHATESQLRQYIGIDNEQNAEEIAFSIMQKRKGNTDENLRIVNS
jgi:site-specific recombinase XerD